MQYKKSFSFINYFIIFTFIDNHYLTSDPPGLSLGNPDRSDGPVDNGLT